MVVDARVLVVCTANVCRSPLAAALLSNELGGDPVTAGFEIVSAGLRAHAGDAACAVAADEYARSTGDVAAPHVSRSLDDELLSERRADLIVTATTAQRRAVLLAWPERAGRVYTLRQLEALLGAVEPNRPIADVSMLLETLRDARGLALPARRPHGGLRRFRAAGDVADIEDGHVLGRRAHRATVREVDRASRAVATGLRRVLRGTSGGSGAG